MKFLEAIGWAPRSTATVDRIRALRRFVNDRAEFALLIRLHDVTSSHEHIRLVQYSRPSQVVIPSERRISRSCKERRPLIVRSLAALGMTGIAADRDPPCSSRQRCQNYARKAGGVVEWLMAPVLKTGRAKALVGSNPTPSAIHLPPFGSNHFTARNAHMIPRIAAKRTSER